MFRRLPVDTILGLLSRYLTPGLVLPLRLHLLSHFALRSYLKWIPHYLYAHLSRDFSKVWLQSKAKGGSMSCHLSKCNPLYSIWLSVLPAREHQWWHHTDSHNDQTSTSVASLPNEIQTSFTAPREVHGTSLAIVINGCVHKCFSPRILAIFMESVLRTASVK